jgi:hypothetical protein
LLLISFAVVPSVIYLIIRGIQYDDLSFSLFFVSMVFFFFFLTEKKGKAVFFNISIIILLLGITEKSLTLSKKSPDPWVVTDTPGFNLRSDTLGFKPAKNFVDRSISRNRSKNTILFDVHYTIDENGLRKTPPIIADKSTKSIVFFGCSFTFGHGLNDNQVMPNMVQNQVKNKYKVYNFSSSGYGTHQMLAAIEYNMVDSIVKYKPRIFIYDAIGDHLNRLLNLVGYGAHTPKYILDPITNEVKHVGRFDEIQYNSNLIEQKITDSEFYNLFKKKQAKSSDVTLFVAMVKKSQTILKKKYPESEFHVIFYNRTLVPLDSIMITALQKSGITVHKITDIVPDYYTALPKYCVSFPTEQHPNGILNKKIADYIVNKIVPMPKDSIN